MAQSNRERFESELTLNYIRLFAEDSEYVYSAAHITPEALAAKMTASLTTGSANKDGKGIRRTCKALGVPYTYAGIRAYLQER